MKLICAMVLAASSFAFADQKSADPSDKVTIGSTPLSPMVIDATLELSNGQVVIPPWFIHHVVVENQADDAVTISSINYFIQDNSNGNIREMFASPAEYDYSIVCTGDGISYTKKIEFSDFGTYAPKYAGPMFIMTRQTLPKECPPVQPQEPVFYRGQVGDTGHHDFTVNVTYQGWFGPQDAPTGRFNKMISFTTN